MPTDTHEVMRLFAIAARAVCAVPESLEDVSQSLVAMASRLVPPEASAANECMRLWRLFARVAQVPKETLRIEAGRAYCRDLDALGQRLDLPPLADWDDLPDGLDDPTAIEVVQGGSTGELVTLASVRERARSLSGGGTAVPATEAARLVSALNNAERRQLFEELVGRGFLGRSDVNLLIRFLVKGGDVGSTDTMLVEVLERLGGYLAQ